MNLPTTEQRAAATAQKSAVVIASAGTGKTTVLVERFRHCLTTLNVPARSVLAFTFTEKAAREMRDRITAIMAESANAETLNIGTIHAFCRRLIAAHPAELNLAENFDIASTAAVKTWETQALQRFLKTDLENNDPAVCNALRTYGADKLFELISSLIESPDSALLAVDFGRKIKMWRDILHKERLQVGLITFADMENLAVQLLKDFPKLRQAIRKRYQHILVDEFQDISPKQFELIQLLWDPKQNFLFAVGDPKQSIYRFRGAESRLFAEATSTVQNLGGELFTLSQTFRTPKILADFFNDLFPKFLTDVTGAPLYQHVTTSRQCESAGVFTLSPRMASGKKLSLVEREQLVGLVADLIQQGVSPDQVAILSYSRSSFPILAEQLKALGIAHVSETPIEEQEREATRLVTTLLMDLGGHKIPSFDAFRALSHPAIGFSPAWIQELTRVSAALGKPATKDGITLDELIKMTSASDADAQTSQFFQTLRGRWQNLSTTISVKHLALAIFADLFVNPTPEDLDAISKLEALITSWEKLGATTANAVAKLLSKTKNHTSKSISAQDQPIVKLLTIHAAKGLEFDHVFLTPGGQANSQATEPLYDAQGAIALPTAETLPGLDFKLNKNHDAEMIANAEDAAEARRLLYVALTRAKKRLYLFPPPMSKTDFVLWEKGALKVPELGNYNDLLIWIASQAGISPLPLVNCNMPRSASEPFVQISEVKWTQTLAFSKPILPVTEITVFATDQEHYTHRFRSGFKSSSIPVANQWDAATRGTFYHEVLQYYRPERNNLKEVVERALFNLRLSDHDEKIFIECREKIEKLMAHPDCTTFVFSNAEAFAEWEFTLESSNCILSGQIDRLVQLPQKQNAWAIVDFKTNRLKNQSDREELITKTRWQMLCYALAVQKIFKQDFVPGAIVLVDQAEIVPMDFSAADLNEGQKQLNEIVEQLLM